MITKKKKKWLQKTEWSLIKLFQKLHLLPTKKRKKNIFFLQFRKQYFKKFKFFQIISILPKYINIFNWNLFFYSTSFIPSPLPPLISNFYRYYWGAHLLVSCLFLPSFLPPFLPSSLPFFLCSFILLSFLFLF